MRKVVALVSGGVDSAVLLSHLLGDPTWDQIVPVFVDFHHAAADAEHGAIMRTLKVLEGRSLNAGRLRPLHVREDASYDGWLNGAPKPAVGMSPHYVPLRNTLLALHGLWSAFYSGASEVHIGINYDDSVRFPDCTAPWVAAIEQIYRAYSSGCAELRVSFRAPLLCCTRKQVMSYLHEVDISPDILWSCYAPVDGLPCDACDGCVKDA